ncbi:Ig-like domain-containing protein [Archangium violaceum]|uniref:Ig-like domain-containing protein n=1 Tax=Archangium violaceum TaxID=83451 RepID=UPI00194EBC38|nr:Ig-like domain-containing protein [Archangium violaceum]QRN98460.1 Ig-like domain-containing protein [Archangium violaceum]
MRLAMHRWMGLLCTGLLLVGCGGSSSDEPPKPKPSTPVWAEDNPRESNDLHPRLRAHAEAGTTLRVFKALGCYSPLIAELAVDESGLVEFSPTVEANRTTTFSLISVRDGVTSSCSETFYYHSDTVAPEVPKWSSSNPKASTKNELTLTVTVRYANRVELFASDDCTGTALGTATVGTSEQVSFPVTVAHGSTTSFTTRSVDSAGNSSECSAVHTFSHDLLPPSPPVLRGAVPSPNSSRTFTLIAAAEPGSTVSVYKSTGCFGGTLGSKAADDKGEASFSVIAESNGLTTFSARTVDIAGNGSSCSEAFVYTHDGIAPEPVRFLFSPESPANDNAPLLQGTTEPGARVLVFTGSACAGDPFATPPVSTSGSFEVKLSVADDTSTPFSAYAIDPAGNMGACASTRYVEDSIPPAAPSGLALSPGSPNESNTVTVSGTSVPSQVLLFTSEGCTGTPLASSAQLWSEGAFSVSATVPENATTSLYVTTRDEAGNRSECRGPLVYIEDSLPPDTSSARVADGPSEDLRYQLVSDVSEANWTGFTDANGVVLYEYLLATVSSCDAYFSNTRSTTTRTSARLTGLSLSPAGRYFHCVRAKDSAGNWTPFVVSDGFQVDLSPPSVSGVLPSQGSVDVDIHAPLRFTFSEPVDVSGVTAGLLTLEVAGERVETTVACETSGTSCTFTPSSPLPYRETVRATLAAAVKDPAGRVMQSPVSVSFTTRGRAWQPPREVRPTRPGLQPDVALDGQGQALAVWVQGTSSGAFRPFASRSEAYAGWEPARELDTVHPGDAEHPAVAVNESGFGVAVWELHDGAQVDLYAAEYTPGTGWGRPHLLESGAGPVSTPRVGVDAQGNVLVVWRQSDGTAESLWATRLVQGGGWSSPLLLEAEAGATSVPALAVEKSGQALAAWLQPDSGGSMRVRASRFVPGSGWTPPEQAADFGAGASVAAALSANGSAVLVFRGADLASGAPSVQASRFVPGEGWSAATLLGSATSGGDEPAVAIDRWGRAVAAWTAPGDVSASRLSLQRFTPEDGWQPVEVTTGRASQPSVAADGQGNFHIVWVANVSGVDRVYAARYPEGATALVYIGALEPAHGGTSKRPRVRANAAGAAVTAWYRDNGGGFSSNLVYAASYE